MAKFDTPLFTLRVCNLMFVLCKVRETNYFNDYKRANRTCMQDSLSTISVSTFTAVRHQVG